MLHSYSTVSVSIGRSAHYTSPSTILRNIRRQSHYFKTKIEDILKKQKGRSTLAFSPMTLNEIQSSVEQNNIFKNSTTFTNFPKLCQTCQENHCRYDFMHQITFSIQGAVSEALEDIEAKHPLKIPPDGTDRFRRP